MKVKKNSAFTLIETMIALVIAVIAVGAIYYSYLFFNNSYQGLLDKAAISDSGRTSLSVISKDLRNAGYRDINYNRSWDRWIEQVDNYNNTGADSLVVWYNTSPTERLRIRYYLKKYSTSSDLYLAREVVENPTNSPKLRYCERYKTQKNCEPQNIVSFVTDFQVVFKDINGNELRPVCANKAGVSNAAPSTPSCSTVGKENQAKVHTVEVYLTVRSPNKIYKKKRQYKIVNNNRTQTLPPDKYHRETFYISVYLRNIIKI
jgi:prepilin-type N-terminal cleavage/methylation domain-containing protein|tara:strand:- start:1109 stop:1891 length:783 start_codon:yes stop_codon:yes gene_type:complete